MQRVLRIQPHSFRSRQNEVDARRAYQSVGEPGFPPLLGRGPRRFKSDQTDQNLRSFCIATIAYQPCAFLVRKRRSGQHRLVAPLLLDCPLGYDCSPQVSKTWGARRVWRGQPFRKTHTAKLKQLTDNQYTHNASCFADMM